MLLPVPVNPHMGCTVPGPTPSISHVPSHLIFLTTSEDYLAPVHIGTLKSRRVNLHTQTAQLVSGTPGLEPREFDSRATFVLAPAPSPQGLSSMRMEAAPVLFTSTLQMEARHVGEAQ